MGTLLQVVWKACLVLMVWAVISAFMQGCLASDMPSTHPLDDEGPDPCDPQARSLCSPNTLLPDPYSCDKYIQCLESVRWVSRTCPSSSLFDTHLRYCVRAADASCHTGGCPHHHLPACDRREPCTVNELLPDPYDCTTFYQCGAGQKWVEKSCPDDMGFDQNLKVCARSDRTHCHPQCPLDPCSRPFPCPHQGLKLPDPDDCTGYYQCSGDGSWIRARCEPGETFDRYHKVCGTDSYQCFPPCYITTTAAMATAEPDVKRHMLRPTSQRALEHQSVSFECHVTLSADIVNGDVSWTLHDITISARGARFDVHTHYVSPNLTYVSVFNIDRVSWSDSGNVSCTLTSRGHSLSTARGSLSVLGKPSVLLSPLTALRRVGESLVLTCWSRVPVTTHPDSSRPVDFTWLRNGVPITADNKEKVKVIAVNGSTLTVDRIDSSALYTCYSSNPAGRSPALECRVTVVENDSPLCRAETHSGIVWPEAALGDVSMVTCPGQAEGEAFRLCELGEDGGATWKAPNLNHCVDPPYQAVLGQLSDMRDGLGSEDPQTVIPITRTLESETNRSLSQQGFIPPGNLNASVSALSQLAMMHVQYDRLPASDPEVTSVVRVSSNLLSEENSQSWSELLKEDPTLAVSVMATIDQYKKHVAEILQILTEQKSYESPNIVLSAEQWRPQTGGDLLYPRREFSGSGHWVLGTGDTVSISREALVRIAKDLGRSSLVVSSSYYRTLNQILRVNGSSSWGRIVSKVLAVSVNDDEVKVTRLTAPIKLFFECSQNTTAADPSDCSFWDYSIKPSGGWSTAGCRLVGSNLTGVWCECDHMTNFAILVSRHKASEGHQFILSIISLVGCIFSILGMAATITIYLLVWKMIKSDYALLLLNLCVSLILANIVFLAGINQTQPQILCTVTAALLHYLFLAAFFLMFAEAIELLLYIVFVFHVHSACETVAFLLTAWGLPAVIVIISLGVTKTTGYGNEDFCWLSLDGGLLYAFLGPVCLVILANIGILAVVLYHIITSSKHRDKDGAARIRTSFWNLAVLGPLLGIGWVFGIFAINEDTVAFQYIFAILNSFQGLFIFLFHCAFNTRVRQAVKDRFNPDVRWTSSFIGQKRHTHYRPTFGSKSNSADTYSTSGSSPHNKRKDNSNSVTELYRRRESARLRGFTDCGVEENKSGGRDPSRSSVGGDTDGWLDDGRHIHAKSDYDVTTGPGYCAAGSAPCDGHVAADFVLEDDPNDVSPIQLDHSDGAPPGGTDTHSPRIGMLQRYESFQA